MRQCACGLVLAGWLLCVGAAHAQEKKTADEPRKVMDEAGLFSEAAKQKANEEIAEIKRRYHKDVLVETLKEAPGAKAADLSAKEARQKFFRTLASERARKAEVDGVYVLITLQPKYAEWNVDEKTLASGGFTSANGEDLLQRILSKLKDSNPDLALLDGVAYVRDTLGRVTAQGPKINDEAGLFSEGARKKAQEQIAEIKRRFHKDLLIETLKSAPDAKKADLTSAADKRKFFDDLATRRAEKAGIEGVYVLITLEPRYVVAQADKKLRTAGVFTQTEEAALAGRIIAQLKTGERDAALQAALTYTQEVLSRAAPGKEDSKKSP